MSDEPADPELPVMDAASLEDILKRDLANVMEKAKRGLPLTARERGMVADQLGSLRKDAAPGDFALEAGGPPSGLEGMTLKQLAGAWGVSERTVKGWTAEGRAANDPVPLTRPGEFAAWYQRVHPTRICKEKYLNAAKRILSGANEAAAVAAGKPEEKAAAVPMVIEDSAKGLQAMLERHRETEARLGLLYQKAVEEQDEVKASFLFTQWTKMGEQLRSLEKIAPKTLEELGVYIRKDEIQRELEMLHRAILKTFRQQLRMCRARLRAAETAEEWNAVTDEIVEEGAAMLVETSFNEPLELEAA